MLGPHYFVRETRPNRTFDFYFFELFGLVFPAKLCGRSTIVPFGLSTTYFIINHYCTTLLHTVPSDVRAHLNFHVSSISHIKPCFLRLIRKLRYSPTSDKRQCVRATWVYGSVSLVNFKFAFSCRVTELYHAKRN